MSSDDTIDECWRLLGFQPPQPDLFALHEARDKAWAALKPGGSALPLDTERSMRVQQLGPRVDEA